MDRVIRNGLLITSKGRVRTSIGIQDGLIAGLYEPGFEPAAPEVVDASGLTVIPGVIDMHSHHREGSQPGFEYKDTIHTSTMQCAAGGVTTSVGMPNVTPPPNSLDLLKKQFAIYQRDAVVDWNFNPAPTIADEIPRMAEQGITAFKIFMVVDTGRSYPHMPGIGVHDHGRILEIMQHCAAVNVPLMVHPHDQALMDVIEKEFWERQQRDALAYAKAYAAHDGLIWETAIATLLRLQKAAGCHLHILHTQTSWQRRSDPSRQGGRSAGHLRDQSHGPCSSVATGRRSSGWGPMPCPTGCLRRTCRACGKASMTGRLIS